MNAAQAVMAGDAAMYFHGDWAKGYLVYLGAIPDVDIGVVAAPGTQGLFIYNIDVFAIPKRAPNEPGAKAFLSTIASDDAQASFNRIKGSSSIRSDVSATGWDHSAQSTLDDLRNVKVRMVLHTGDGWDDAAGRFTKECASLRNIETNSSSRANCGWSLFAATMREKPSSPNRRAK